MFPAYDYYKQNSTFIYTSFGEHRHSFLLGIYLGVAFRASVCLALVDFANQFSRVVVTNLHPLQQVKGIPVVTHLHQNLVFVSLLNFRHFDGLNGYWYLRWFNLHFSDDQWGQSSFHVVFAIWIDILFYRMCLFSSFAHYLIEFSCLLIDL